MFAAVLRLNRDFMPRRELAKIPAQRDRSLVPVEIVDHERGIVAGIANLRAQQPVTIDLPINACREVVLVISTSSDISRVFQ